MIYFVYILMCKDGSLYTGIAQNVSRRFREHKADRGGHYTRSHHARKIVYTELCINKSTALKREIQIKKLSRVKKLELISGNAIF
jgi:putative endonuclease